METHWEIRSRWSSVLKGTLMSKERSLLSRHQLAQCPSSPPSCWRNTRPWRHHNTGQQCSKSSCLWARSNSVKELFLKFWQSLSWWSLYSRFWCWHQSAAGAQQTALLSWVYIPVSPASTGRIKPLSPTPVRLAAASDCQATKPGESFGPHSHAHSPMGRPWAQDLGFFSRWSLLLSKPSLV